MRYGQFGPARNGSSLFPEVDATKPVSWRSRTVYVPTVGWISFKGGGWTWGERQLLVSRKGPQMVFGIFGRADAEREVAVSGWLRARTDDAAEVLGWVASADAGIFPPETAVANLRHCDGSPAAPVVLVTRSGIPVRIAELAFLRGSARSRWMARACQVRGWSRDTFATDFAGRLGAALARLHSLGGTNDVLSWDNVTLAAEWTDFEWLYVPGHPLPEASTDERLAERQWKSCIDAFEVVDRLTAMLGGDPFARRGAIRGCLDAYERSEGPVAIRSDWNG